MPSKGALDERLLADANTADSLPLLQFTLRQLYERRSEAGDETLLTHAAYDALGGLQGAIAAEAERAVAGLPAGAIETLPRLLRRLAEPARDGKALTLREVAQSDVAAEPAEAALVERAARRAHYRCRQRLPPAGRRCGSPTTRCWRAGRGPRPRRKRAATSTGYEPKSRMRSGAGTITASPPIA